MALLWLLAVISSSLLGQQGRDPVAGPSSDHVWVEAGAGSEGRFAAEPGHPCLPNAMCQAMPCGADAACDAIVLVVLPTATPSAPRQHVASGRDGLRRGLNPPPPHGPPRAPDRLVEARAPARLARLTVARLVAEANKMLT